MHGTAQQRLSISAAEAASSSRLGAREWRLGILAAPRPGEIKSVALFFGYAFLLLVSYYILKLLREPLLLTDGTAELKSYAYAAIALVLMVLVPVYSAVFRRTAKVQLVRWITAFFLGNVGVFYFLGRAGVDIGFAYYVWVGVFGVAMLAQFWAHAAHSFDVETGQRLFPVIMAGATFGALAAPALFGVLFPLLGTWNLMLVATALLAVTLPLVAHTRDSVPAAQRHRHVAAPAECGHAAGGFRLVLRDRYLLLLALLMVLLNCVNTTGEFILTELVLHHVDVRISLDPALDKATLIAGFFGDYYFAVNAVTVLLQVAVVARVFRWIGVQGALLVVPIIALLGYGLIVFVPIFSLIWVVKVLENGTDYSLMNTTRQALYLPLPAAHQYDGKTAIDTFFWRLGDVAQAAVIYIGLHRLGLSYREFALFNMALALAWILIAGRLAKRYSDRTGVSAPRAPRILRRRASLAAVGLAALTVSAEAAAAPPHAAALDAPLFASEEPLDLELVVEMDAFCRNPQRAPCADAPGTLIYRGADGERRIGVALRARGRWRRDTANCELPALFVRFDPATTAGTPFAGQETLALTTHCRASPASFEQYLLKEYLAYRIYNTLAAPSLHVRLVHIDYRDAANPGRGTARYGFFTEHFESLAARQGGDVLAPDDVEFADVDASRLAVLELFEYMIGNTDWSAVYGHNVVHVRDADGVITAVPFDFDYSGLVDAPYAAPAPQLSTESVRQRVYRGFCRPGMDWTGLFEHFRSRRGELEELARNVPGLAPRKRDEALAYLGSFYATLDSERDSGKRIVQACRDSGPEEAKVASAR